MLRRLVASRRSVAQLLFWANALADFGHRPRLFATAICLLCATGCCVPPGVVQGRWVLITGQTPAAGLAQAPTYGNPLVVSPTPDVVSGCFTSAALDQHFGDQCTNHQTEGGGSPAMAGDVVGPGAHPTPGEVRWYCDKHTVVRVILARCTGTDSFRATEIDLARQ
jgi:hypothetical protein